MLDRGEGCAAGEIVSDTGDDGSNGGSLGGITGGLYINASSSRETSRAAAALNARSSSGSSRV